MGTRGKCLNMCPPEEIEMRERERLLHPLEVLRGTEKNKYPKADPYRMVKCFCRSAAGVNLACPSILRPPEVLIKTITYLFTHVVNDSRFSAICVYDFIVDRLRSIQQDMVIQDLPPEACIQILEPIVRFHAISGYRLCEEKISHYDPVLNKKHLLEYLKRLLVCYDEIEPIYNKTTMPSLINNLRSLSLHSNSTESDFYTKNILSKRPVMEAVYIICNLGDSHPLERYLKIPDKLKTPLVKTCFIISLSHITRNWVRECQLIKTLPPIVMCVSALHLPAIRRIALEIMSHAYSSKVLKYPIDNFKEILLYGNNSEIISDCQHYNIQQNEEKFICFLKESFNNNDKAIPPKKIALINENIFQKSIEKLLLVCS